MQNTPINFKNIDWCVLHFFIEFRVNLYLENKKIIWVLTQNKKEHILYIHDIHSIYN